MASTQKFWISPQGGIEIPFCVKCRKEMSHSCTEREAPAFEHRVYECKGCRTAQSHFIFVE